MTELPPSRDAALRPEPLNGSSLLRQAIAALLMDEAGDASAASQPRESQRKAMPGAHVLPRNPASKAALAVASDHG
jgi:hypothetical protein